MLYNNWISEIVKRCQNRFDRIVVGNNLEYGPEFEIAVAEALKDLLPTRCGVCRGYVVAQNGEKAGEDIIIYDRARFQTLHGLGDDLARKDHVPIEAGQDRPQRNRGGADPLGTSRDLRRRGRGFKNNEILEPKDDA